MTTQPANRIASIGTDVSFSVVAIGSPTPTVQWQVSTDQGKTWGDILGATSATLRLKAKASLNGNVYRAGNRSRSGNKRGRGLVVKIGFDRSG